MSTSFKPTWGGERLLLEVRDLTVYYGTVQALDGVSLSVEEGEIVAMIGPNGAGKSTALKAICGLIRLNGPSTGEIFFQGERIENTPPYTLVEKGISLVPEGRRLFPTMTVLENLEMGAYTGGDRKATQKALGRAFELFPVLKERRRQRAGTLSSGEQQMLAMGRALMLKPKLLLLDEPSLGLSPNYVDAVFQKIREINRDGTAVLLVEQNARMALEVSDRGIVFKIGGIALEGRGSDLLEDENVRKAFLGE